ncbi:MAG: hypothetical protein L0228_13005 [Planctomycetes bacterium]|nr:hypothetical protein [Planctomycetota bacterium]
MFEESQAANRTSEATTRRKSHDPTDVRYGTRSLLMVMAVVAVVSTALGAFVRLFPADVRPRLVVHWGILFVMLGVCIAYNARRRYVAEKQAGAVRFLLTPHSYGSSEKICNTTTEEDAAN